MNMSDDEIFQTFCTSRGLSYKSQQDYLSSFKIYTVLQELTLQELLDEAEKEEQDGVRLKHRTLKKRLISFKNYLIHNYTKNSVNAHFTRVKALYRHFEIELPYFPTYQSKQIKDYEPVYYQDLPNKEIIKEALNISNPIMKAIILFMSSSGCARKETLNITIKDFINSVKDYTVQNDSIYGVFDDLKTQNGIVPMFRLKRTKTNKYYYTFCSPEATKAIISYLITRTDPLKMDSPLFKVNLQYFNVMFNEINDKLNLGKVGPFNRFRSHMLRKFHASNLSMGENSLTIEEIDNLQGRTQDNTHRSYFMEDPNLLKEKYILAMDKIMIKADITHFDSPEVQKIKDENKLLKAEREDSKKLVLNILKEHGAI